MENQRTPLPPKSGDRTLQYSGNSAAPNTLNLFQHTVPNQGPLEMKQNQNSSTGYEHFKGYFGGGGKERIRNETFGE
jgi:hypothetical protein